MYILENQVLFHVALGKFIEETGNLALVFKTEIHNIG